MEFSKWLTTNIKQCEDVYSAMAPKFHTWFYSYCKRKGIKVKQSDVVNEAIDSAIKFRLGLSDSYTLVNDKLVSEVLESLMYGAMSKSLKNICNQFLVNCELQHVDSTLVQTLNTTININHNSKLDYL